jgi:hypothetical protein
MSLVPKIQIHVLSLEVRRHVCWIEERFTPNRSVQWHFFIRHFCLTFGQGYDL